MNLHQSIQQLLKEAGPGRSISIAAYDTAWVARLVELDHPLGERALDWLRSHQLPDGSWGASEPRYYHDRLICTLAAVTALARRGDREDRRRWQRAQLALEWISQGLGADPTGETIGFEMIVPTLLAEAEALGIIKRQGLEHLGRLFRYREAKLDALPRGVINRYVTLAFSAEMAGLDGLDLLDVEHLQEPDGSVAYSPSATAHFALYVSPRNAEALDYLHSIIDERGGVPDVAPFDVFERGWVLWNLALLGDLDEESLRLCQPLLDKMEADWLPGKGVGFASGYPAKDSDETSLAYEVLIRYGRSVDLEAVLHYEEEDHYRCFDLEANPSISANIHVLGALRKAGLGVEHPSVQKVLTFLRHVQTAGLFWLDKWHVSPYYPTAHAIVACAGYVDDLIADAVWWILVSQNENGSWGYYAPTAEETAYCLQALTIARRNGMPVPTEVLKRGANWLAEQVELPYPPLWIGKCLYCPELVVRSAILSALALVAQE